MKHLQKNLKTLEKTLQNILQYPGKSTKHLQQNISITLMKHLEQMLATYMYIRYHICNIPIYFCNIYMKHLQHFSETSETLENIRLEHALFSKPWQTGGRAEHYTTGLGARSRWRRMEPRCYGESGI